MEKQPASNMPYTSEGSRKYASWWSLMISTILASYFFVFIEWLFDVTRPSFMSLLPFATKLGILLLSGLALAGVSFLLLLLWFAASLAPWWSKHWRVFVGIGSIVPGIILASAALLMIDNFTYTVFKFGIVSTAGVLRGIYGLLFLILLAGFTLWVFRNIFNQTSEKRAETPARLQTLTCTAILLISVPLGGRLYLTGKPAKAAIPNTDAAPARQPNILLIGSDGLNDEFLSLYGYEKDTTPFLKEFAKNALLAENNFTNANVTTGSLTSMFTGKLPLQTHVQFPPDILKGANAYEHLPGILKREGYYTALISVDYYGDANAFNLQDGFVTVNGRSAAASKLYAFSRHYLPEDSSFFLSTVAQRLSDRVLHIYYIRTMVNPYAAVTQKLDSSSDPVRMEQLFKLLRNTHQPLFLQVYMMGTHIFLYDDYDQAVRNFDGYVQEVVNELKRTGKLDQTVIVIYTDHGKTNQRKVRTPLLIRFPNGEYAGKIVNNTQNLDIPPTILDYLGLKKPDWMAGRSLLKGEPPADRPIFSTSTSYSTGNGKGQLMLDMSKIKPPFYQFENIDMIICNHWYTADTSKLSWQAGVIQNYPTPCDPSKLPDNRQAQQIMLDELKHDGYDVSTLESAWGGR